MSNRYVYLFVRVLKPLWDLALSVGGSYIMAPQPLLSFWPVGIHFGVSFPT